MFFHRSLLVDISPTFKQVTCHGLREGIGPPEVTVTGGFEIGEEKK
jgi:hypothetical protein